ncbi:hypothetical protein [Paenibacillus glacialis]|uniref:Thymidylate kinase-like domain-containing protein n=1 Tax=Paenibacillus glacialis TaxID=494026 RepID=A0A168HMB5_9BACL|nr:hypothetical protein [Paenibacillus glacialis]OAB38329.1 hypothetical protein PGLA_19705 [Paenibacillus glacialis]
MNHPHKLIIVDGIPGSGKSTLSEMISKELTKQEIKNIFYHELTEKHPLFIYDCKFITFKDHSEAEYYFNRVVELFNRFVELHKNESEVIIIESILFQDTLSFAYNMGMDRLKIKALFNLLVDILSRLNPILIYIYQLDVRRNWEMIGKIRGVEWIPSLHTQEGLDEAERDWKPNQEFIKSLIEEWEIPKLIIENKDYLWEQYTERTKEFLEVNSLMSDSIS